MIDIIATVMKQGLEDKCEVTGQGLFASLNTLHLSTAACVTVSLYVMELQLATATLTYWHLWWHLLLGHVVYVCASYNDNPTDQWWR